MSWDTENRGPMPRHLQPGDPSYDRPLGMDSQGRSKEPSEMEQKQLLTEQLVGLMGDVVLLDMLGLGPACTPDAYRREKE